MKLALATLALLIVASPALAQEKKAKGTRFWNLTGETIAKLELAPTGTQNYGPDQAKNDKDGAVDNDERVRITDTPDGTYDARITDKKGRVCTVAGLVVKAEAVVSVEREQLTACVP